MSFIIGQPSGGGGGGSDAFSIDGITTDFGYQTISLSNSAGLSTYTNFGELFRLDYTTKIASFDIKILSLATTTTARFYTSIYKFNINTKDYDLIIECPQEFDVSSTGVTGWNKISLPTPIELTPGVYMKYSTSNESGGSLAYPNHSGLQMTGWLATGTNQIANRHLQKVAAYNYLYPAPPSISGSYFNISVSQSIPKVFLTTTN